jgi:hypothetical protein
MSDYYQLAGDKIVLEHEGGSSTLRFGDTGTGRVCGACSLCCKLLPVPGPPLNKPANTRCQHQKHSKGCAIYTKRPMPCRVFACRWLADRETAGMPRPDRCHYVIDIETDYVEAIDNASGERRKIGVIQVWVDPAFPLAHRSPDLRAYMLRMAEQHGYATIIRYNSKDAFVVFPPPLATDHQWHEESGQIVGRSRAAKEADILQRYRVGVT